MKQKCLVFIIFVALLIAGCSAQQSTGIPENTQENQRLYRSFEEIVASHEAPQDIRPHHYGAFSRVLYSHASTLFEATTLEDLLIDSSFISIVVVRGRLEGDARIVFSDSSRVHGSNIVSLEILEVIRGDLGVGETVTIMEPYFILDGTLHTWRDYMPSIPHQEYIFFLEPERAVSMAEGNINAFLVAFGERSRYPIPGTLGRATITQALGDDGTFSAATQNFSSAIFGLGTHPDVDVDIYMSLWEDVMNEYVLPTLTGILLSQTEVVLPVGNTHRLFAMVLPIGSAVTWTSSDPDVATVNSSGVVTGVSAGTTTITATTADGEEATSEILVLGGGAGVLPGDVNGDGVVDFLDLLVLIYYLDNNGNISPDVTFVRENADLNGDGVIDDRDLEILMTFLDVLGDR